MEAQSIWGQPLSEYATLYQFEKIKQPGRFNEDPAPTLTQEAVDALSALSRVGSDGGAKVSSALPATVTMQNFRSILKLVQYPKAYRRLARPLAISGCIKLMSAIKLKGKHSPFSYEYGYLCFRVLTIVLGICILHRSDRLDISIEVMQEDAPMNPEHDIMQHLGHHVSSSIFIELKGQNQACIDLIFGRGRGQSLLVTPQDIALLSTMLWDDRKTFFKALKSTYYPGIASVVFVLWQINRQEQNTPTHKFQSIILSEIHFRYSLLATSDQQHAITYMNVDINSRGYRPVWEANTQQVDLEDCREIVSAYIDRFNPLYPILHSPIAFLDGPILLRPLLQFIVPGTSDLLPKVLEVTVKRIWEEVEDPSPDYKPDMLVDAVRDTFANYMAILQTTAFRQMDLILFEEFISVFIKCGLIDLAARAILLLELPSEPPAHELAGSVDYLPRTKAFFGQVCIFLPPSCMYIVWDLLFPDWFKYRSYLVWYSEIRELVPKDREHIRTRLATWNEIGMALGYQVHEKSPFWCGYARCHDPLGMGGVQFTCPMCRNGTYCSARCQSLDWRGPQAAHASICASARILLKTQSST